MAQPRIRAQASRLTKDLSLQSSSATTTIPRLVYGTAWKKGRTQELVYTALKHGFRGIDTAAQPKHYDEHGVKSGLQQALDEGFVKREDLFVSLHFPCHKPRCYNNRISNEMISKSSKQSFPRPLPRVTRRPTASTHPFKIWFTSPSRVHSAPSKKMGRVFILTVLSCTPLLWISRTL
jgi:hypothetical protein